MARDPPEAKDRGAKCRYFEWEPSKHDFDFLIRRGVNHKEAVAVNERWPANQKLFNTLRREWDCGEIISQVPRTNPANEYTIKKPDAYAEVDDDYDPYEDGPLMMPPSVSTAALVTPPSSPSHSPLALLSPPSSPPRSPALLTRPSSGPSSPMPSYREEQCSRPLTPIASSLRTSPVPDPLSESTSMDVDLPAPESSSAAPPVAGPSSSSALEHPVPEVETLPPLPAVVSELAPAPEHPGLLPDAPNTRVPKSSPCDWSY